MTNLNQSQFNQIARNYDNNERIKLAKTISSELNLLFNKGTYDSLLDYGGGTGLVTFDIEHHFNHITVLDASPKMVEICNTKIKTLNKTNIAAIEGDLLASNNILLHQTYDVILLSLVLLHSGNYMALLQQLVTQLNSNGLLIIVDFDKTKMLIIRISIMGSNKRYPKITTHNRTFEYRQPYFYQGKNIFMNKDASLFLASGQLTLSPQNV